MYNSNYTTVFRAWNITKNQKVLIKTLNTEFNNPINISKIQNKFNLLKKLESEYTLKAYDYLEFQNRFSVTFEDTGGVQLSQYMNKNYIELKELLQIGLKIAKCIKHIHRNHVMHKDINPFNLIYNTEKSSLKLFGFENSSEFYFETAEALNPSIFQDKLYYISPEQTGRMNRPIDYRTDFYSLGVILYELACSKLPFSSSEPDDIVYFHIAKNPLPINEINPSIPTIVSKIILKLMEKMPEDRYKSASGIEFDLQECINQLEENGFIEEFELGKNDILHKFEIPKKIYGRDKEINKLLRTFERASKGNVELILVGGYSGIGKTVLVNELHKPIMKNHGILLSGKCDQYNRNTPYSALFNALDQFCNYILSDSEVEVSKWREKIVDSIGENSYLLLDVIPRLQLIIGGQPKLEEETLVEIQIKFSVTLQKLLEAISSQSRPIVFFIDDVQWIDTATLELFQKIIFDNKIKGLMFICTYRENEVDISHPLIRTIENIKKYKGKIEYLSLDNLDINAVTEMMFNIFSCNDEDAFRLAKIVQEKTLGNPFYIIEFLKYCNKEMLLYYSEREKRWVWNESGIRNSKTSDNVVDLLIEEMKTLSEDTKELIFMAACIGNRVNMKILSVISGKDLKDISEALKPAISSEMIYLLGKDELNSDKVEFIFCHDKFQQAGYFALTEEDKKIIHMKIATYYENAEGVSNTSNLFLAAEHYSKILDCIKNEEEIKKVINIFFDAAKAARLTAAFDTARQYIELIMEIGQGTLKTDDSFMYSICTEYHLVLFSLADFKEVDKVYLMIEKMAKDPLQLVNACCIQLISLSNRSRYEEAFYLGISLLEKLGVSFPEGKLRDVLEEEVEKFYLYQCNGSIETIKEKELLYSEKDNAIAKLLNRIIASGLFFNPLACFWAILVSANLMVEKGVTSWALEIASTITLALVPLRNDYYTGYKFAKNAISILKQRGLNGELYRFYHVHSLANCHWFEPLEVGIYHAHKSYGGNLENGEFEFSCFSFFTSQADILECCNSISEMQYEVDVAISFATKTGNIYSMESFVSFLQFVKCLKGETISYGSFNDSTFNEEKHLNDINKNGVALAYYYIYRALSAMLFSNFKVSYALIKKAVPYLSHVAPCYIAALQRFITSISICKVIDEADNTEEKRIMEKELEEAHEWMCQRAKDAPFNFQHLYHIVSAEIKALQGIYDEAFKLYEKAILEAEKNKRPYHYALICELTGQRYLKLGIKRTAGFYFKEAYSGFLEWGAVSKVMWMKEKYKNILFYNEVPQYLSTKCNTLNCIDLKSIINVSQTISREIERKKLLEKLMKIVMQNSGSTRGHILLKDKNNLVLLVSGRLNLSLELIVEHKEVDFDNQEIKGTLPSSIINYVARTKEELIIDNVTRSQFAYDDYFEDNDNTVQSVMCLPILQQNTLKGVLYLENDILSGAFTRNNIEVFKIIASQAAISIENAFLYTKLENKVKERTSQLEETISKLKETNTALEKEIIHRIATENALIESKRQINYSKEYDKIKMEFFANISHELRTPINVIFSALQMNEYKMRHCSYENANKDCFKYGNTMKQNCYRLLRLINNLIDITKIDTGYFNLNEISIDIISLIEDITLSVADYVENKGLSLIFDTDVEEKVIACDPEKIERIILNLLSNAAKFTSKGGRIMVTIEDGVESICIRVKDNGRGIPKEKQNSIFERFVQVDKSFTRDHEGSGIGLSLVKALVELHGGTISVKSTEGFGSEFIVSIPCKSLNENHDEIACCEELTKSCIEKINIEFSDIYK